MVKDECILVDERDVVTGHANKYQSHRCVGAWVLRRVLPTSNDRGNVHQHSHSAVCPHCCAARRC